MFPLFQDSVGPYVNWLLILINNLLSVACSSLRRSTTRTLTSARRWHISQCRKIHLLDHRKSDMSIHYVRQTASGVDQLLLQFIINDNRQDIIFTSAQLRVWVCGPTPFHGGDATTFIDVSDSSQQRSSIPTTSTRQWTVSTGWSRSLEATKELTSLLQADGWVFKVKTTTDGTVSIFKASLWTWPRKVFTTIAPVTQACHHLN